ncbi:MAG: M6 family metalloprotease domain-containing protein [Bacteroides sp.]|nr:M6 family metalloprotease domain-containing protein [Bacteroides sp.]
MKHYYQTIGRLALPTLGLLMLTTPQQAEAVPAYRGLRQFRQPDGTTIEYRKIGDEHSHIILSADGTLLAWNGERLDYASLSPEGVVAPTGVIAHEAAHRQGTEKNFILRIDDEGREIFSMRNARDERRATVETLASETLLQKRVVTPGPGRFTSSFPPTGDVNVLVVLVQYQDVSFNLPDPYSYFNNMLNEEGFSDWGHTGCAKEYFRDNSRDQFRPRFDVYGPVTLPEEMAYYGGNSAYGSDTNAAKMIVHAADILDDTVDFSQYDMNDDGYVDNVFVIYAGQGEATYGGPDTVWPHSYDLLKSWEFVTKDGVMLNHYACCNEWLMDRPDGVGTFIHEFSHVIGLPDLYSTQGRINATPSSWSVLDYGPYNNGGCTPPNYSAFERYAMGWLEPRELKGEMNLYLEEIGASNDAAIIPVSDKEYFLFENRQKTGWDTYLPGHGMLVWHVDYDYITWEGNNVNNDANHQRVDIIEAGGKTAMSDYNVLAQYPFPGTTGNTALGSKTTPSLLTWAGEETNVELTEIEESAEGNILARINGGVFTLETPVLTGFEDLDGKFRADWNPVADAVAYELEVTALYDGEAGTEINAMGNGSRIDMPEGWSAGSNKSYTTSGNYGNAAPSYKMETDADWILSPEYPADITSLTFWMKGTQTLDSTLDLFGLIGGEWVKIETFTPQNNKAQTVEATLPAGVRQIKLVYNMVKGRVAIDDIEIVYGHLNYILEDYNPFVTSEVGATVDFSQSDAVKYSCRLRALSADDKSRWSEPMIVTVNPSGIAVVESSVSFRINGHTVEVAGDKVVSAYDLSGRMVATGAGSLTLPASGLYIVSCEGEVRKVVVR